MLRMLLAMFRVNVRYNLVFYLVILSGGCFYIPTYIVYIYVVLPYKHIVKFICMSSAMSLDFMVHLHENLFLSNIQLMKDQIFQIYENKGKKEYKIRYCFLNPIL